VNELKDFHGFQNHLSFKILMIKGCGISIPIIQFNSKKLVVSIRHQGRGGGTPQGVP
jgi:hypothetical protein